MNQEPQWEIDFDTFDAVCNVCKSGIKAWHKQQLEKLIDDIPDEYERGVINLPIIKQELKDKWLGKQQSSEKGNQ